MRGVEESGEGGRGEERVLTRVVEEGRICFASGNGLRSTGLGWRQPCGGKPGGEKGARGPALSRHSGAAPGASRARPARERLGTPARPRQRRCRLPCGIQKHRRAPPARLQRGRSSPRALRTFSRRSRRPRRPTAPPRPPGRRRPTPGGTRQRAELLLPAARHAVCRSSSGGARPGQGLRAKRATEQGAAAAAWRPLEAIGAARNAPPPRLGFRRQSTENERSPHSRPRADPPRGQRGEVVQSAVHGPVGQRLQAGTCVPC